MTLRLVVSEVRDQKGRVLAQWLLLSNVEATVGAARLDGTVVVGGAVRVVADVGVAGGT